MAMPKPGSGRKPRAVAPAELPTPPRQTSMTSITFSNTSAAREEISRLATARRAVRKRRRRLGITHKLMVWAGVRIPLNILRALNPLLYRIAFIGTPFSSLQSTNLFQDGTAFPHSALRTPRSAFKRPSARFFGLMCFLFFGRIYSHLVGFGRIYLDLLGLSRISPARARQHFPPLLARPGIGIWNLE